MGIDAIKKLEEFKLSLKTSRHNPNIFIETVMRDNQGNVIKQGLIHETWQAHIDVCNALGKFPIILAPFGHGKSMQIAIGRILYEIGRNPNIRIKVVSNTDANAAARVEQIKSYINAQMYPEYKLVFPNIHIDRSRKNLSHEFTVVRQSGAIDATIQSYGVFGSGISGRADLLVIDDIVDKKNTIINPAMREKVISTFWDTWYSRLDPKHGKCYGVGTVWAQDDLWAVLKTKDEFCILEQAINDDCNAISCKAYNAPSGYPNTIKQLILTGYEIWEVKDK